MAKFFRENVNLILYENNEIFYNEKNSLTHFWGYNPLIMKDTKTVNHPFWCWLQPNIHTYFHIFVRIVKVAQNVWANDRYMLSPVGLLSRSKKCPSSRIIGQITLCRQSPKVVQALIAQNLARIRSKLQGPLYPTIYQWFPPTGNDGPITCATWAAMN